MVFPDGSFVSFFSYDILFFPGTDFAKHIRIPFRVFFNKIKPNWLLIDVIFPVVPLFIK